ncbi:nicotinate-nucleotide--dimethylbenzimidazole phosphoribosyltransferase [Butyrivibrio sp. JL13D10]|uniref:nicotinate-nucleotide--dimethylbenzimidazole phosphoribosyltransferase n=1 Tax=Butyrivibrio sp. JL13D10 TaxID=3236815 RepID=UPI0038B4D942
MTKEDLFRIKIDAPDREAGLRAKSVFNSIAKPLDGLGDFEELICKIASIQRTEIISVDKRAAVIMCADNGIVEEGVSQSGKEITLSVAKALGNGISSACTLGKAAKVDIIPVDIGIASDEIIDGVRDHKISPGTNNFLKQPSMTETELLSAVQTGIDIAGELSKSGFHVLLTGEMGIGNTTTSAAVLSAALALDSDDITGRGAGIDDKGFCRKKEVIKKGLQKYHFEDISDQKEKAFRILQCVGGLDIAGLSGLIIGGAINHVPVVVDGIISSAAAVIADMIIPGVREYLIASHAGREKGNITALRYLGLKPYINGDMALGEGTGAIMLFPLIDTSAYFYNNAARFEDYKIEEYKRYS